MAFKATKDLVRKRPDGGDFCKKISQFYPWAPSEESEVRR